MNEVECQSYLKEKIKNESKPVLRRVRNTLFEWWVNREPYIDISGVRTLFKDNKRREILESLRIAFEKIIKTSMLILTTLKRGTVADTQIIYTRGEKYLYMRCKI